MSMTLRDSWAGTVSTTVNKTPFLDGGRYPSQPASIVKYDLTFEGQSNVYQGVAFTGTW